MPDAAVTVMVLDIKGDTFYVVGKVGKPGVKEIGRQINVMQALAVAGGLTPFANEKKILILRHEEKAGQKGRQKKIYFNYSEVKKGENLAQNIWLEAGDVIVVP